MTRIDELRLMLVDFFTNRKSTIDNRKFHVHGFSLLRFLILVTSHWSLATAVLWACPLCKEALFSPGESAAQGRVAQGYALSIAALLGAPLLLVGGIMMRVIRSVRHK